jgi:hypothetical protein
MKKTNFYPNAWHVPPYPYNMMAHDTDTQTKDLVLSNPYLKEKKVSEIEINLVRLSAFDNNGIEHFIEEFPGQELVLKGMGTGLFLKTKSTVALTPGKYKSFRFYVREMENTFTYADKSTEKVYRFEYLDFDIENALVVQLGEEPQIIFRFDLAPFSVLNIFKPVQQIFRKSVHFKAKMSNSLGF